MTSSLFPEVSRRLKESGHRRVRLAVTDIDGVQRGKYVHIEKFLSAAQSDFGFCSVVLGWDSSDVCYDNSSFAGWHNGYPDMSTRIDLATERQIPWNGGVPFFLADFAAQDGSPLAMCPRQLLKRVIARLDKAGYSATVGCEYEWFNFSETAQSLHEKKFRDPQPITPGMFGYSILRSSQKQDYFSDLMNLMEMFGVPLEGLHTETGPGVYEAAILRADPLEAADRAVLFKTGTKEIASEHGITASFMARWSNSLPGSGGHLHISLQDKDTDQSVFFDDGEPNKMSRTFRSFLAGLVAYSSEFLCMFAPTVNSYKRLVEGYWAPTSASWGVDNRTCALRVIPGSEKSTRIEVRIAGADLNPYLALAAALGAGLLGIEQNLELESPQVVGNGYDPSIPRTFAHTLQGATEVFKNSQAAVDLFGEGFCQHYAQTREWEWRQSLAAVTDWELERYFEII